MAFINDSNWAFISLEWWKGFYFYRYVHTPLELSQGMVDGGPSVTIKSSHFLFFFQMNYPKIITWPHQMHSMFKENSIKYSNSWWISVLFNFSIVKNAKYNHFLTFMFCIRFAKWKTNKTLLATHSGIYTENWTFFFSFLYYVGMTSIHKWIEKKITRIIV